MNKPDQLDQIAIGGGIGGLILALRLERRGIASRVEGAPRT